MYMYCIAMSLYTCISYMYMYLFAWCMAGAVGVMGVSGGGGRGDRCEGGRLVEVSWLVTTARASRTLSNSN